MNAGFAGLTIAVEYNATLFDAGGIVATNLEPARTPQEVHAIIDSHRCLHIFTVLVASRAERASVVPLDSDNMRDGRVLSTCCDAGQSD
jgi:hypothetical protein